MPSTSSRHSHAYRTWIRRARSAPSAVSKAYRVPTGDRPVRQESSRSPYLRSRVNGVSLRGSVRAPVTGCAAMRRVSGRKLIRCRPGVTSTCTRAAGRVPAATAIHFSCRQGHRAGCARLRSYPWNLIRLIPAKGARRGRRARRPPSLPFFTRGSTSAMTATLPAATRRRVLRRLRFPTPPRSTSKARAGSACRCGRSRCRTASRRSGSTTAAGRRGTMSARAAVGARAWIAGGTWRTRRTAEDG